MAVKLSALRADRRFTTQKYYFSPSGTHFCYRLGNMRDVCFTQEFFVAD
jgi:hypothetical protein